MTPLKSLLDLWSRVAYTFPETNPKSALTLASHCKSKGLHALTTWLPQLGKLVDLSLSSGLLPPLSTIVKTRKGTNLPVFLNEYFTLIYDNDGYLRDGFDPAALRKLRTLLFFFYKYEVDFTDDQVTAACQKFIDIDDSVKTDFCQVQIDIIRDTFLSLLPPDPLDLRGRHSNGATADGMDGVDRREIVRYIPSLMGVYGAAYFFNSVYSLREYTLSNHITCTEPLSKVAFVPKDSRGPRTICMEPHERMFIQQGLMHKMYTHIEKYSAHRGRVNFSDQSINQRMALKASLDGSYATLDLKDASDLVSWSLIKALVSDEYKAVLTALRTENAILPDGTIRTLKKFAPMGSALCFPIEASLFYSICRVITDDVYVYGDDIIVPQGVAQECIDLLESYGLIVNREKSLLTGFFRESCGMDAYKGHPITPIRYRRDDYASVIAFANNISKAFGHKSGEAVITWYESIYPVIIPRTDTPTENPSVFHGEFSNLCLFRRKNDAGDHAGISYDYQRDVYRIMTTTARKKKHKEVSDDRAYFDWINSADNYISPTDERLYSDFEQSTTPFMRDVTSRFSLNNERLAWKWAVI